MTCVFLPSSISKLHFDSKVEESYQISTTLMFPRRNEGFICNGLSADKTGGKFLSFSSFCLSVPLSLSISCIRMEPLASRVLSSDSGQRLNSPYLRGGLI